MKYCFKCGNELTSDDKFCGRCGTPNINKEEQIPDETRTRKVNKLKKCPSCGELIPTYTVICPSCGYEINDEEVSNNFADFLNQIKALEHAIQSKNDSFNPAALVKKILWIILNVFLICIPLLIKLIINLLSANATPKLTQEERQLATFVENYTFPNNREVILEALVFAKEKIDFASRKKLSRKNAFWVRLWCSKAKNLKDKADLLFPGDLIVERSFQEILKDKKKIETIVILKIVSGIVLLGLLIFAIWGGDNSNSNQIQWQQTGIYTYLPDPKDYYGEIIKGTDESLVIELTNISEDGFKEFKQGCLDKGFVNKIVDEYNYYYAESEQGNRLMLFYNSDNLTLNINLKIVENT